MPTLAQLKAERDAARKQAESWKAMVKGHEEWIKDRNQRLEAARCQLEAVREALVGLLAASDKAGYPLPQDEYNAARATLCGEEEDDGERPRWLYEEGAPDFGND
jgi:hypothetical protein